MKKKTYSGVEDKMFSDVDVNDCESVSLWEWDCWLSSSSVLSLINKKIGFKIVNIDTIQYNKVYIKFLMWELKINENYILLELAQGPTKLIYIYPYIPSFQHYIVHNMHYSQ